jgi:hypothetical protein
MRGLVRRSVAGAIMALAATLSAASSAFAKAENWDGSIVVTAATAGCASIGEDFSPTRSFRALYRPRLLATDPKAALIFETDNLSHIWVIRATTTTRTLAGTAAYMGIDFDPGVGESTSWLDRTYTIGVQPAAITAQTKSVVVFGTIRGFSDITSCNLTFRGIFQRRPQ